MQHKNNESYASVVTCREDFEYYGTSYLGEYVYILSIIYIQYKIKVMTITCEC